MASFWIGVILSSALLVYSDQGVEHLKQFHCKPKPGCTLAKCGPMPDRWSVIGGLNPPSHEYPILCQNEEDSSCCEKFEEMKSENKRDLLKLELRLELTDKREAEARLEIALLENEKSDIKKEVENLKRQSTAIKRAADESKNEMRSVFKTLELRLEMTEEREAEAKQEIALLKNEKSEIMGEVENLKNESTAIKRAADESKNEMKSEFKTLELRLEMTEEREAEAKQEITLLKNEKSKLKKEVEKLKRESTAIKRAADENKNKLQTRIESIEKMVNQLVSKQTVPQINPTDQTMGEVTTTETVTSDETTAKSGMEARIPCHGVLIERKCYFAVIHETMDVRFSDGDRLCADSGGKPADILNVDHQDAVENYIRGLIPSSEIRVYLWTAMTYNTRQLRSSSGASLSLRWSSGFPSGTDTAVKMFIYRDAASSRNGIYNVGASGKAFGFICEI